MSTNPPPLWDFTIRRLAHNRPDNVVAHKNENVCYIIKVACPGESSIVQKEDEKVEKYHRDLGLFEDRSTRLPILTHLKEYELLR